MQNEPVERVEAEGILWPLQQRERHEILPPGGYSAIPKPVLSSTRITAAAKVMYQALLDICGPRRKHPIKDTEVQTATGLCRWSVVKARQNLLRAGLIDFVSQKDRNGGTRYTFFDPVEVLSLPEISGVTKTPAKGRTCVKNTQAKGGTCDKNTQALPPIPSEGEGNQGVTTPNSAGLLIEEDHLPLDAGTGEAPVTPQGDSGKQPARVPSGLEAAAPLGDVPKPRKRKTTAKPAKPAGDGAGGRLVKLFCDQFKVKVGEAYAGNKAALGKWLKGQGKAVGEIEATLRIQRWFQQDRRDYGHALLIHCWQSDDLRGAGPPVDDAQSIASGKELVELSKEIEASERRGTAA